MKWSCACYLILVLFTNGIIAQDKETTDLQEYLNLTYLSDPSAPDLQKLNLVLPKTKESVPLLVWIGGGAWSYVDRNMEMDLARKFAKDGIAVAAVGHRLSSAIWKDPALNKGVQHPAHIQDIAAAIAWLYKKADQYGYDAKNIFVGGYSSGGHLAALVALDEQYLAQHQMQTSQIRGIIPIAAAYDISNYHEVFLNGTRKALAKDHVEAVFGPTAEDWMNASPTSYLEEIKVPILLISERNTYNYTRIFEDALREKSFQDLAVVHISHLDHAGLWKDLSFQKESLYRNLITDFIRDRIQ